MMNQFPISSVAQRATQCGNVDGKIGRLDENIRPNASHQFLLADQLTWVFKQNNQDFQSTTSEGHWLVAVQQKLCRPDFERRVSRQGSVRDELAPALTPEATASVPKPLSMLIHPW